MASTKVESTDELWKDVVGYEGYYQISDLGRVRTLGRIVRAGSGLKILHVGENHMLQIRAYKTGYLYVGLSLNGVVRKFKLHRLVGLHFVPNPDNKSQVEHINTIRSDCRATNLRWATNLENQNHPLTRKRRSIAQTGASNPMKKNRKRFAQIDPKTNEVIKIWLGVKETAAELGFDSGNISRCCTGKRKQYNGFIWRYVD